MSIIVKKGEQFECIESCYLNGDINKPVYLKGFIYTSEGDNCITDETGNKYHLWTDKKVLDKYFKKINKENNDITEDKVNHPLHYTWLKGICGIEVIDITRHMNFNLGNCIKYILRSGHKSEKGMTDKQKQIEDLKKAKFYIDDEIKRLENE